MVSKTEASEETKLTVTGECSISVRVNEELHDTTVPADMLLVNFLRDVLRLTGTKFACDTGHCGSCTVLVDGLSVKSCAMLAAQADGSEVVTIEGVGRGGALTALQSALSDAHAIQCGYCTPGIVLSLMDLLGRNPHPSEFEIRRWIDGNICRCGVYQNVVRAVHKLTTESA
jgi:aerobic carbon-monoxide dehydrogenase small subunit